MKNVDKKRYWKGVISQFLNLFSVVCGMFPCKCTHTVCLEVWDKDTYLRDIQKELAQ